MNVDIMREEIDQLREQMAQQRRQIARSDPRHRLSRRLLPLALAALLVALVPLASLAAGFTDLNPGSPHNDNINAIAAAGITRGCNPPAFDNYCPNDKVTREEMASFLARTAGLGGNAPVANAATALSAQNATALGGQPASFYQPAGQPIANATTAANADKLGNQPASAYLPKSAAFVAQGNFFASVVVDNPLTNGHPNAILIVTNRTDGGGAADSHPFFVQYNAATSRWFITNADGVNMPANATFNVLVINP